MRLFVVVEGREIKFVELSDEQQDEDSEEFIDIDNMDQCCSWTFLVYELGESCPDYLILDAEATRVKVNLDGFFLMMTITYLMKESSILKSCNLTSPKSM